MAAVTFGNVTFHQFLLFIVIVTVLFHSLKFKGFLRLSLFTPKKRLWRGNEFCFLSDFFKSTCKNHNRKWQLCRIKAT